MSKEITNESCLICEKIPSGWKVVRIQDVGRVSSGEYIDASQISPNGDFEVYGANGIRGFTTRFNTKCGRLAIGRVGSVGEINLIKENAWVSDNALILESKLLPWLIYWLTSFHLKHKITTTAQPLLTGSTVKKTVILMPPIEELRLATDFLDRETALIDKQLALIEKKRALLSELKKSVVHEAVTKGLDRSVAMKDSGVPDLKDIPTNWSVKRLKDVSYFASGWTPDTKKEEFYEGKLPWATIGDLPTGKYIRTTKNSISESAVNLFKMDLVPSGILLFSFKLSIGQVAITERPMFTNEAIAAFTRLDLDLDYAYYALPYFVTRNCKENIYGAKLLNRDLMLNSLICVPPVKDQQAISDFLNQKVGDIEHMMLLMSRQESLIKEQRQALIHEVVTGKRRLV